MYHKSQLTEIASQNNIECYQMLQNIDDAILLPTMTFDEFISFTKRRGIDTIFYYYNYLAIENYLISESTCSSNIRYANSAHIIKSEIDKYNSSLENYDFTEPYCLSYYCIYNGKAVGNYEFNNHFKEYKLLTPDEAFNILLSINQEKVLKKEEDHRIDQESLRNEFKEQLIEDKEFRLLTNMSLRKNFARKVLDMPQYKKYSDGFDYTSNTPTIIEFIECTYREYKQEMAKK